MNVTKLLFKYQNIKQISSEQILIKSNNKKILFKNKNIIYILMIILKIYVRDIKNKKNKIYIINHDDDK